MQRIFRVGRSNLWSLGLVALLTGGVPTVQAQIFKRTNQPATQQPASGDEWSKVVAEINGEKITRADLAQELIETHGAKQIGNLINRRLVEQACRQGKVEVSAKEIDEEFERMLKSLNIKREEFVTRLLGARDMTLEQYLRDMVWPKVALRKLAGQKVQVSDDDMKKAFEATFGEKVEIRLLVVKERHKADQIWKQLASLENVTKRLEAFEEYAKKYSVDEATRAVAGRCEPICKHSGFDALEREVFRIADGDLGAIQQVPDGFMVLMRVKAYPPAKDVTLDKIYNPQVDPKATVRDVLYKDVYEKKLMVMVSTTFEELQRQAKITNYLDMELRGPADAARNKPASEVKPVGN